MSECVNKLLVSPNAQFLFTLVSGGDSQINMTGKIVEIVEKHP